MTLAEARIILGLQPQQNPQPHLEEFRNARERIAEMVRTAPNESLAARYQAGLMEFDRALAAVREHFQESAATSPPMPDSPEKKTKSRRAISYMAWFFIVLIAALVSGYVFLRAEQNRSQQQQAHIEQLSKFATEHLQNRRWQDALEIYRKIETIDPGSVIAAAGRSQIKAGQAEEQNQFLGYWTGQALAELEAGRLDEADAAIRKLTSSQKYANQPEAHSLVARIANARSRQARNQWLEESRTHFRARNWQAAQTAVQRILQIDATDREANELLSEITAGIAKQKANEQRSAQLFADARARDKGHFDEEAVEWLREAIALNPAHAEAKELLARFSSYTRTLRVPEDFPTPAAAVAAARGKDRVVIGEMRWNGCIVINSPLVLEGAGVGKTIFECAPQNGNAIVLGPGASGARISGITFLHTAMLTEPGERFSAALVRGGEVQFSDCHFRNSAGHGIAVVEKGKAHLLRCEFQGNTWNGAAAIGSESFLHVKDSTALQNFGHGFEIWDGASGRFLANRCEENGRNGIHAGEGCEKFIAANNRLLANREFGLVISDGKKGAVTGNHASANLMGGIVIRLPAAKILMEKNTAVDNRGPGLIFEKGLSAAAYSNNTASKNETGDVFANAPLGH